MPVMLPTDLQKFVDEEFPQAKEGRWWSVRYYITAFSSD
jgi:hypothetical protein